MRPALALLLTLTTTPALAQSQVDIDLDADQLKAWGLDPVAAQDHLEGSLEERLNLLDQEGFLSCMHEAAGVAGKGIGVDYASNPDKFVVGFSIGSGAHASGVMLQRGEREIPEAGFAFQASAMAALNLGAFSKEDSPLDRFVLSVHGFGFRGEERMFRASMHNFGGHVTAKVVGKVEKGLLEWGGLDVTTGFERATYSLGAKGDLPLSTSLSGVSLTWLASGSYDIRVTDDSLPLELSTNLRVSFLTVFAGAGVDWHTGSATSEAVLAGPIEGSALGETQTVGSGSLSLSQSALGPEFSGRAFGGVQINVFPVKVYAQVNVTPSQAIGGHAGLRVAM